MTDLRGQYFVFDAHEQVFKCKVDGCTGKLKDSTSSLRRHIAQLHPDIASQVGITAYKRKSVQVNEPVRPAKRLKAITVYVDPIDFRCSLMEMPAIKSIPFNFFNSKPCRSTIGILAKALNIPSYGEAIASDVSKIASIIRQMVSEELQSFFCLEFDGAQRHNRKIFGINARILNNGKFKTRTLSMMEISTRQTGENLKVRIEEVLAIHNTDVKHIYSCTTDNGKNMLKCVTELDKSQQLALDSELNAHNVEHVTDAVSEEVDETDLEIEPDEPNEEDVAKLDDEVDEMLEAVENIFLDGNESCISTLKCTAHTVNLVVKDAVDMEDEILKKIRKITKACRKTEYGPFFDLGKIPLPKVDVETRWGSLFKMIESFNHNALFYKDLGQKFPELNFTEEEWVYIEEFIAAFEPLHVVSKKVQADDLVLGDIYKFLKLCQLQIKKVPAGNRFSEPLQDALNTRAKKMLDNNAFRAALLFDQRWCFMDSPYVTTEDKLAAIEHMLKVSNIMKSFKTPQPDNEQPIKETISNASSSAEDDLEALLEEECQQASPCKLVPTQVELKVKLLKLANTKQRLPVNTDIIKYWESRRFEDPELYELAMIALAASATQVSVERCFSGIKLLLEQHRLRMSSAMLNDLMTLRFNKDLIPAAMEKLY